MSKPETIQLEIDCLKKHLEETKKLEELVSRVEEMLDDFATLLHVVRSHVENAIVNVRDPHHVRELLEKWEMLRETENRLDDGRTAIHDVVSYCQTTLKLLTEIYRKELEKQ